MILAGGASRRFGTDKCAALLGGRPLLERVLERARPQVELFFLKASDPEIGKSFAPPAPPRKRERDTSFPLPR
ncbi:MAG TPA: NTP transferase domain-containing protein [Rhizomicrobium sp.]